MNIAAGTYKGRAVAGAEQYGSTSNGHDQIVILLHLVDLGQQVSTFLVFSEKAAPYAIERLRALGWTGDDLSNLAGIDQNDVNVEIAYETWEGKERMRVQILTGNRVTVERPMDDKNKRIFAAKYKSLVAATRAPASRAPVVGGAADVDFPYGAQQTQKSSGGVKL